LFDINRDGINPSLGDIIFTLDQLPAYTDFTNLYQSYRLVRAKVTWRSEYLAVAILANSFIRSGATVARC